MSEFFSREELLGGLPARRASTLLFAIESRAAQLAMQSRQAAAGYVTEVTAAEQERAFLFAIRQERDLPVEPTIQDLERYAPQWASLVPPDPSLRVAVARLIGEKYRLPYAQIPALRQALGLDDETIHAEYERRYAQPLDQQYVDTISRREQVRWRWMRWAARLENMPPFWIAFSLTLTETVGASILALPIALAGVGPLAGVMLLLVLGLVNLVTIIGIVEAITRNGNMRYGNTYFGRLVSDYLGEVGRAILTPALLVLTIVVLLAYYIGISTTLADATPIPSAWWAALMFLVGVYFLRRESIDATVASALIVGAICLVLLITLSLLALLHVNTDYLSYVNLPLISQSDEEFDPAILNLIFGVVLAAYFGHTSAGNSAKLVLRRDPTGRALLWGNLAAMSVAMLVYCLWVIAVNGAIDSTTLAATSGTVLIPLTDKIGGVAFILGSIYAVLAMGMASIHMQLGLFLQTREWLPNTLSRPARFWAGMIPPILVIGIVEWLLITGRESFAGLLGFVGALALPLLSGIFPMLLLAASRRKGDYVPGVVLRALVRPPVMVLVYGLYLAGVFVQGLVIWERPLERAAGLIVGLMMIAVTGIIARRGAFIPRAVIELRVEASDTAQRGFYQVTAAGQAVATAVQARYADGEETFHAASGALKTIETLQAATFELPPSNVRELKVWAHQITPEGSSLPLVFTLNAGAGSYPEQIEGQTVIPITDQRDGVTITLACDPEPDRKS